MRQNYSLKSKNRLLILKKWITLFFFWFCFLKMRSWLSRMLCLRLIRKQNMKTSIKCEPKSISWLIKLLVSARRLWMIQLCWLSTQMMSSISPLWIFPVSQEFHSKIQIKQQMSKKLPRIWHIRKIRKKDI